MEDRARAAVRTHQGRSEEAREETSRRRSRADGEQGARSRGWGQGGEPHLDEGHLLGTPWRSHSVKPPAQLILGADPIAAGAPGPGSRMPSRAPGRNDRPAPVLSLPGSRLEHHLGGVDTSRSEIDAQFSRRSLAGLSRLRPFSRPDAERSLHPGSGPPATCRDEVEPARSVSPASGSRHHRCRPSSDLRESRSDHGSWCSIGHRFSSLTRPNARCLCAKCHTAPVGAPGRCNTLHRISERSGWSAT
jgi:hypothetical protein